MVYIVETYMMLIYLDDVNLARCTTVTALLHLASFFHKIINFIFLSFPH